MIIIGIAGRKRSGKGSIAAALNSRFGFRRYSFGAKLKLLQKAMYPWIPDEVVHGEDRERVVFQSPPDMVLLGAPQFLHGRSIQQAIGQGARHALGAHVWVNALIEQINEEAPARVVIEDIRQPNEAEAVKHSGGYLVRTNRTPRVHFHHFEPGDGDLDGSPRCQYVFAGHGDAQCGRAPESHPISWTEDAHETEWALPEESLLYDRIINAGSAEEAATLSLAFASTVVPV